MKNQGIKKVIVPSANLREAKLIKQIDICEFDHLSEVIRFLEGKAKSKNYIETNIQTDIRQESKLHQKQAEIAKRSGKAVPEMQMEMGDERNRK